MTDDEITARLEAFRVTRQRGRLTAEQRLEQRRAAGRKGGEATKKKYGSDHYSRIGKIGGRIGGDIVKARYGPDFFSRIGQMGNEAMNAKRKDGGESP